MQPTLAKPFHCDGWIYEEKYDGWRIVAIKDGRRVQLVSRIGRDHPGRFSGVARAVAGLRSRSAILDGEVCVSTSTSSHASISCGTGRHPARSSRPDVHR